MTSKPQPLVRAEDHQDQRSKFSHPLNPASEVELSPLSRLAGLERAGVSLARLAPGKESFAYHSHLREEEWIYILSGEGTADIDGEEHAVRAGDFMGFPTPSVAHNLRNTGTEELVYLMGGECLDIEVADFPQHGLRMLRQGHGETMTIEMYDPADARPFAPASGDAEPPEE